MADAAVEGLDLSLVTDILMLSATSPWTVYIADRNQVHLKPRNYQCKTLQRLNSSIGSSIQYAQKVRTPVSIPCYLPCFGCNVCLNLSGVLCTTGTVAAVFCVP